MERREESCSDGGLEANDGRWRVGEERMGVVGSMNL